MLVLRTLKSIVKQIINAIDIRINRLSSPKNIFDNQNKFYEARHDIFKN